MNRYFLLITLLLPSIVYSSNESYSITKGDLAKEVVHCYVAHMRYGTELYTSDSAEKFIAKRYCTAIDEKLIYLNKNWNKVHKQL